MARAYPVARGHELAQGLTPGRKAFTIFGWTPGIRRIVGGRVLPCGCLVGSYETRAAGVVEIMDGPDDACSDPSHTVHMVTSRLVPDRGCQPGAAAKTSEVV